MVTEPWNEDSGIKWQISEQAVENFCKATKGKISNFTRLDPTGVNSPNADFIMFLSNGEKLLAEMKNWYRPIDRDFLEANVLIKFLQTDALHKNRWILIVPRLTKPARQFCKEWYIEVVEFKKQLVTKKQWTNYSPEKKKHASETLTPLLNALKRYFGLKGSRDFTFSLELLKLQSGFLVVETVSDLLSLVVVNGEVDENFPFMSVLRICEHCGKLHTKPEWDKKKKSFCSLKCFHAWGGTHRIRREKN